MNRDYLPAASANDVAPLDATLWRELIAQTAHATEPAAWFAAACALLEKWLTFDFALALEFSPHPPHLTILAKHGELPPTFHTDFETFELDAAYVAVLDTPASVDKLAQALDDLRALLTRFHYGSPVFVPLTADGRALGVLTLVRNPHPETRETQAAELARVQSVMPALGALLGAALRRARLQERLTRATARLDAFVAASADAFWETDADLNLTYVNQAACALLGLTESDLIGQNLARPLARRLAFSQDRAPFEKFLAVLLEQGAVTDYRLPVMGAHGGITVSVSARVQRDAAGKRLGIRGSARDVTAQVRAQHELEQRTRELEWLYELAWRLNQTIDPRQALRDVLTPIVQMLGADAALLGLFDKEMERFEVVAHHGVTDELLLPFDNVPYGHAATESDLGAPRMSNLFASMVSARRVLTTQELLDNPHFDRELAERFGHQGFLAFPILFETQVYGLALVGSKQSAQLDAHGTRLGSSISAQLGLALHTYYLIQAHERSAAQARMLAQIGRKIQYAPRAEQVLYSVARDIKTILEADYVVIQLLRANHFQVVTATDMRETAPRHPISDYERKIIEADAPLTVTDCESLEVDPQQREILRGLHLRATIAMRLYAHDHPLGILFVNQTQPRRWRQDQVEFTHRAAQQIAYALENKRLLDESVKQLRVQRALENAARLIASALAPEDALRAVADELLQLFQADYVAFHLLENERLVLVAESDQIGAPRFQPIAAHQHLILRELEARIVQDRDKDTLPPTQLQALRQYNFYADIGMPLVVGKDAIGILYLSQRMPREWSQEEIYLAETFARQIALAVQNVRLFRETRAQVRDLRALARSAQLIATSRSLPDALPLIAAEARRFMHADYAGFHLVEGDKLRVITEPHSKLAGQLYPIANYHRLILEQSQRIVTNDIETEARDQEYRDNLKNAGLRADIAVPMVSRNRPIGIMFVSQALPRVWSDSEIRLVETFAQQIANVLDLVQVLNDQQARVRELQVLTELHDYTLTMPGREALQELILPLLQNLLQADNVVLAFVESDGSFLLRASKGRVFPKPLKFSPTIQRILDSKEPFVFDAEHPHTFQSDELARFKFHRARAVLSVPMVAADGVVGLLNVVYETEHVFSERAKQLTQAVANQLALAVANAGLLEEQGQRATRSSRLTEFALFCNAMQNSAALQTEAVRRICDILNVHAASIRLVENGALTVGASFGYRDASARQHPIPINERLAEILYAPQPFEISDLTTAADLPARWRDRHLREGFNAGLIVPMVAAGQLTGALSLFHLEPHRWTGYEIEYARTMANILALALANLQARERAALQSQELQATVDSAFSGILTTDADGVILSWNRKAEQITGYPAAAMLGKRWDIDGPRVGAARRDDTLILEAMADRQARFGLAARYFTRADGQVITLREVATPLLDAAQNVHGAVGSFWDRTQEQAAERQKLDFINETAHQLNTKLGVVTLAARRLLSDNVAKKMRAQYTRVLQDTIQDLQGFQNCLAEVELERLAQEPTEEPVDVRALLNEQITPLRVREPGRHFRVDGEFDLALADPTRLRVVLENLLDNACKYSPPRSRITVSASCAAPDKLTLRFHNRSAPIPKHLQPHLFERRQRGAVDVPGTGLGLWLAQTKLHEMGGEIELADTTKPGVTFIVTLRRKTVTPCDAADS